MAFGLSGVIPAIHYVYMEGWLNAVSKAALGWLFLMGCLYILGALFYALRIPERWFPGKVDLWVCISKLIFTIGQTNFSFFKLILGTISSNFPCPCNCSCFGSLSRNLW